MKYPANVKWGQQLQVRLLGKSLFLGDSQTDVLNTGTQRVGINVGIEVHEQYPVCIRCGLENTKCSNMGEESALSQQCHSQLALQGALGKIQFPIWQHPGCSSTSVLPCATSLGIPGTGTPSCLPPLTHLTQHLHPAREFLESSSTTSSTP